MRSRTKEPCPPILNASSETWCAEYLADPNSNTKKFRYRHPDIKSAIRAETSDKCVYCEAKVGHNTPGDIEHILPSSKFPNLRFEWENLTLACAECNRRKSDYHEEGTAFLNPYEEEVEEELLHMGPLVTWRPTSTRAEVTVRTLELNGAERMHLILQKIEKLSAVDNLLERIASEINPVLAVALEKQLTAMQAPDAEFSAMVTAWVQKSRA